MTSLVRFLTGDPLRWQGITTDRPRIDNGYLKRVLQQGGVPFRAQAECTQLDLA